MKITLFLVLQQIIKFPQPVMSDKSLQPRADRSPHSYSFPSIESHMSVCMMGFFVVSQPSFWSWLGLVALPLLLGVCRVYAQSRLKHGQIDEIHNLKLISSFSLNSRYITCIMGSWLTGGVGLLVGFHCCELMKLIELNKYQHSCCLAIVLIGLLVNLCLAIESNDSRLLYLKKGEFLRVLVGIMDDSKNTTKPPADVQTPRGTSVREGKRREEPVVRDGFYYLDQASEHRRRMEDGRVNRRWAEFSGNRRKKVPTSEEGKRGFWDDEEATLR